MTEVSLQKSLFDCFYTLNDFSGIDFVSDVNVALPNKPFTVPNDKRWFVLSFLSNKPEQAGIGEESQNRWNGFLQIDICTPIDKGEDEASTKYEWISKLFGRGKIIDDCLILRCYIADRETESDHYRLSVRIEWTADIDK